MLKKMLVIGICLLGLCAFVPAFALDVQLSANAGTYMAPGATSASTMYGLSAIQPLNDNVSVRGMAQTTTYTIGSASTTFIPITLDVLYGQTLAGGIRPYAGAGLSYNSWSTSGATPTQTMGAQAEAGIGYNFGPVTAGLEYRYMWPDINHTSTGSTTFNAFVSGGLSESFHF